MPALLNGKREKAKSTKMVTEEKKTPKPSEAEAEDNQESKKFTLAKKLEPEMLTNPYLIEYEGVEDSSEFCLEKCYQSVLEPLADVLNTEEDWLEFTRSVWQWRNQVREREARATAKNLYARAQEQDPLVLEMLLELAEQRNSGS